MSRAWMKFETALMLAAVDRVPALVDVLDSLRAESSTSPADRSELRSVVLSELARLDSRYLDEARDAIVEAEANGRSGWPNYYLGESLIALSAYAEGLGHLLRIPRGFFEERDLKWRAVRVQELEALANLELQRFSAAARLVDEVVAALALSGDEDDLAPPRDLVESLLRQSMEPNAEAALTMLATVAASIDLAEWFDPEMASRVQIALSGAL